MIVRCGLFRAAVEKAPSRTRPTPQILEKPLTSATGGGICVALSTSNAVSRPNLEAEMKPFIRSILVPTDFSSMSDVAIDYATTLAASLGATVHLIHVLDPLVSSQMPWEAQTETAARHERLYQTGRARLAVLSATIDERRVQATSEVRSGTPATEIAHAAADYGADLIVMATHGRTGLPHLLLGSVAEHVIRHTTCPVLVVRDDGTQRLSLAIVDGCEYVSRMSVA